MKMNPRTRRAAAMTITLFLFACMTYAQSAKTIPSGKTAADSLDGFFRNVMEN